jgi:hypothetical protein
MPNQALAGRYALWTLRDPEVFSRMPRGSSSMSTWSNGAAPSLLSGEILTTGTWYYRLHRAINDPMSTGIFSRIAAELSSERRSELIDGLKPSSGFPST